MPRLILDTGPLFDLLLFRFWNGQGRPIDENQLECRKQFNVSPEQISRFLGRYQSIIVVPGVFVEVGRLARGILNRSLGSGKRELVASFWRFALRELQQMSIDEQWIRLLLLDSQLLEDFGPTDATLIRCAQETGEERVSILTHDQPLHGRCRRQQISCILTSEILQRLYA
jgi:hypothetical protein